jgi:transposase InsO family protein
MVDKRQRGSRSAKTRRAGHAHARPGPQGYPFELRWRIVREVVETGASMTELSRIFGVSAHTIAGWIRAFREGGLDALRTPRTAPPATRSRRKDGRSQAVTAARREHPEWGTRRIRDELRRAEGIGISETEARRILHEDGLIAERPPAPREHLPRRFERAEPNQLWQSDIFTFLLRKHERLYLVGFMDDHSRFLVSHVLAHHQRSSLVMEGLSRAIADFGAPTELLTDQGRQYTAWRGETDFEQELRQHGIRHVKSRPQHPQTLGKIERFWKTLWDEFLSRTVFADFADCVRRIGLFVQAYNFKRPHQALAGLVPADRFFRAAPQVRAAVEQSVAENAMRLAHEQPTRKPFYLVGRLGDRDLSISAAGAGLTVRVGDEQPQTIALDKEHDDEQTQASRRVTHEGPAHIETEERNDEYDYAGAVAQEAQEYAPTGGVVDEQTGHRRARAPALPPRAEPPERRVHDDGGVRRDAVLAGHAAGLRAPRARSDGGGVDAGRVERWSLDQLLATDRGARGAGEAPRAGQTARGEALGLDAAARETRSGYDGGWAPTRQPLASEIGAEWREQLGEKVGNEDGIDEEEHDDERLDFDASGDDRRDFDPNAFRGRALSWDRKLAGERAPLYGDPGEVCRGKDEVDVHASARGPGADARSLRNRPRSPERTDGHLFGGEAPRHLARADADPPSPCDGGPHRGHHTPSTRPSSDTGEGATAPGGERRAESAPVAIRSARGPDDALPLGSERPPPRTEPPNALDASAAHETVDQDDKERIG